jgi:phage-related minor tail protein
MTEQQGTQIINLLTQLSTQCDALGMALSHVLVLVQVALALLAAIIFWVMQRSR